MVKSTKKVPIKGEQSITNFFTRVPASSQSSDSAASRVTRSKTSTSTSSQPQATPAARKPLVDAPQSISASNSRADSFAPLGSSPRKPMESHPNKTHTLTRSASLKRQHSPDVSKPLISARKLADTKPSQAGRNTPRKKARLSTEIASGLSTPSVIPSSQSDETELSTPVTSSSLVSTKETVKQWRKQAMPPTPEPGDGFESMDVDEGRPLWSLSRPATPEDGKASNLASSHIPTPPYTDKSSDADDLAAAPPTPAPLDPKAKTARLIEQIKARAAADVHSSPELDINDIPDLSDSDDDELVQPLFTAAKQSAPVASGSGSAEPQLRRSTRQRTSLGASSTGSPVSRRSRLSLSADSSDDESPVSQPALPRARARPNPIAALLKEKQKEEKLGAGSAALFAAELSTKGKGLMLEEMNLEDDDMDYDSLKNFDTAPSFSFSSDYANDDFFLGDEERKELYGLDNEEDGAQINSILKSDQEARVEEAKRADRLREGVPLWTAETGRMAVDDHSSIPVFASAGNSPTLQMLSQAMQTRDFARATTILKSGAFTNLPSVNHPEVMNDLCVLATSSSLYGFPISAAAFDSGCKLMNPLSTKPITCEVSSSFVSRTLLELGAAPEYLQSLGIQPVGDALSTDADYRTREAILYRMVTLATWAAISRRFVASEIPNLVLALSLVAMDPSASHELRRDIMVGLNHVCRSVSPVNGSDRDTESKVAAKLVALAQTYQPVNKAMLLALFAGGTGATMRIARFVAYSILIDSPSESITPATYCDPAPLPPLLDRLVQPAKGSEDTSLESSVFAIKDSTDYTTMRFYLYILGVATTNIKAHVELELESLKKRSTAPNGEDPLKSGKDLDLLESLLEELHSSINDLRAAHLDRSRAKAVVKQLQMRIHYQHTALERAYRANAPKAVMSNWLAKAKASKVT